jgi:transcription initiation factor IIE alpha subunit
MFEELTMALSSVKAIAELTNLVLKAKVDNAVTAKAVESQTALIHLQSAVLSLQSEHEVLQREKNELREELNNLLAWNSEANKYHLIEICPGVFVYASNDENQPRFWLCPHCFENRERSILQLDNKSIEGTDYLCPRCKTVLHDPTNRYSLSFAASSSSKLQGY